MQQIQQRYADKGVVVVGVNIGEDADPFIKAREFRDKHRLTYPILIDRSAALAQYFGRLESFSLPTNAIFDRNGKRVYLETGFDAQGIVRTLNSLTAN